MGSSQDLEERGLVARTADDGPVVCFPFRIFTVEFATRGRWELEFQAREERWVRGDIVPACWVLSVACAIMDLYEVEIPGCQGVPEEANCCSAHTSCMARCRASTCEILPSGRLVGVGEI